MKVTHWFGLSSRLHLIRIDLVWDYSIRLLFHWHFQAVMQAKGVTHPFVLQHINMSSYSLEILSRRSLGVIITLLFSIGGNHSLV